MRKIFISYGDKNYTDSLKRIGTEAENLHLFDEIRLYDDSQLPPTFYSYTEKYKRGGGYWLWKPYIVQETLSKAQEGDVIVYADAGCTLLAHKDWKKYFRIMNSKECLFFLGTGKNRKWCKQSVFDYLTPEDQSWAKANQLQATFFMIKKTGGNHLIERWYELALHHPELFIDITEEEKNENPLLKEHRHDQAVLTGCIASSSDISRYCFLPSKIERRVAGGQAVLASRISSKDIRGAMNSSPIESKWITLINRNLVYPIQKLITLHLYKKSR